MAQVNVEIVKRSDGAKGFVVLPKPLGGREDFRVAQPLSAIGERLGVSQPKGPRIPATRLNPPHAAKAMHSNIMFADKLLAGH